MIGIRVDANDTIAMGHLMRCMSIARQLNKKHVIFIVSDECAKDVLDINEFSCICMNNDYAKKENELDELIDIIKENNIDRLVIDSYEISLRYFEEIKKYTKIIYIDDINKFKYPVDVIINYTYNVDMKLYNEWDYSNDSVKFYLGSEYVPLRIEFAENRINIKENVGSIFITTGGTDSYGMIIKLLKKMKSGKFDFIKKNIVVGKFYNDSEELDKMAKVDNTISVYQNIPNICDIMKKSDIAISAGGTTLAELCACGLPTICFAMADNQLAGITAYSSDAVMVYAGDVRENIDAVVDNIIGYIEFLCNNYNIRNKMGSNAKKIIDGKGAKRIAEIIEKIN